MNDTSVSLTPVFGPMPSTGNEAQGVLGGIRLLLGLVVAAIAALVFLGGTPARLGIPMIAAGAAYRLYRKSPIAYVSFVWWLFFLIPFLRRLIDFRSGYSDQNIVLAAPYLAALACTPTLFVRREIWRLPGSLPFSLAFVSTIYGFAVGFLSVPKKTLLEAALAWFTPLIFGFFLFSECIDAERRTAHIDALLRTFCWGTLLMGCYGIYQYMVAPRWDALWMAESDMGSIGTPEPFALRVFSTMNGPGALAYCLLVGLLLLFASRGILAVFAGCAGVLALLLSSVRAAWATLVLMLILLVAREKRFISRLIAAGALVTVCGIAAMTIEPLRANLQERFLSFKDLQDDTSYQERTGGYQAMYAYAAEAPLGYGLGAMDGIFKGKTTIGSRDSGIWEIAMSLGWIGGTIFFAALGMLAWSTWSRREGRTPEQSAAACVCIGLLLQVPMGSIVGITGLMIWMFGAIAAAPAPIAESVHQEEMDGFQLQK